MKDILDFTLGRVKKIEDQIATLNNSKANSNKANSDAGKNKDDLEEREDTSAIPTNFESDFDTNGIMDGLQEFAGRMNHLEDTRIS